jgi:uncharacterized membrane protein YeaQ/YmgE (transglycosylase-associated protein family)
VRGPDGADGQREVLDSWPKYCSQRRVLAFAPDAVQVIWFRNSATQEESAVEEQQVGWIAAIIIGGIAGWLAEQFMKSQMGLVMNIVLGIIGAAVASWLFGFLGITFAGWIGYLIAGFIGACILIAIARAFSGGFQQRT